MAVIQYIRAIFLTALLIVGFAAAADPLKPQGDNMNDDWLIAPHKGVGRLTFGLSPEAVASMASLYGKPSPLMSHADAASEVEEVIAQHGATMSRETIAVVRWAAQEQANLSTQNLMKEQIPVLLEYRDGRLDGVTVEARHKETNFQGKLVFCSVLWKSSDCSSARTGRRADIALTRRLSTISRFRSTSSAPRHRRVRFVRCRGRTQISANVP
ncbi:hypothetical protein [Neorhizobium sp. DT-125]|uniref:hypothetical protein n=1 Tax=Neorhizobium sp. DT-125 TaxID=3396163 RepID=UPI003F1CF137